ncbi:hypothetical protein R3P38DRAFT_3225262 [Favolaschia claudopus]|uniref:Uncharacterized protein n=1 Tax=Favolaschia claudopus TaxID=2862362 RepID=A0AAV9ZUI1_9AGAR
MDSSDIALDTILQRRTNCSTLSSELRTLAQRIYCRCPTATDLLDKNSVLATCSAPHLFLERDDSQDAMDALPSLRPLPRLIPTLYVGMAAIDLVSHYKYVGIWITSITRNIFSKHHTVKASKARSVSYASFSTESFVRVLPREKLYEAWVDPHLTSGCEVVLDTDLSLTAELGTPQKHFLRRPLDLNPRCMLSIIFTETGILPLRYRRACS